MSGFNSVEFYVIAGTVAAAAVALAALPSKKGVAVLHTAAGDLSGTDEGRDMKPSIDVCVDENRRVHIVRRGLPNITDKGAASLAINVIGFDIVIEERLTHGNGWPTVDTAEFVLDFFAPERYHVRYNSEDAGVFTAFTLPVKEGIKIHRDLK